MPIPTTYNTPVAASGDPSSGKVTGGYAPGTGNVPLRAGTPQSINETGVSGAFTIAPLLAEVGGTTTVPIAAGVAANTVIKATPGRLVRVLVTATGTNPMQFFDNASAASGTIIGALPASPAIGTVLLLDMPALQGITAGGNAANPAVTVSIF